MLRILQTMEFQRVGGERFISVNVRVIAATNRDLANMIRKGSFREDLWFRLNVFPIWIPPLRERKEDIPSLAKHFAYYKTKEMSLPDLPEFSPEAFEQLSAYDWPGNVREMQNVIERELILNHGTRLSFPSLGKPMHKEAEDESMDSQGCFLSMDEVINIHIQNSLKQTSGKIYGPGGAAELLKINPSTLRGKMRKLGITISRELKQEL